jgi:hypothetical protein
VVDASVLGVVAAIAWALTSRQTALFGSLAARFLVGSGATPPRLRGHEPK